MTKYALDHFKTEEAYMRKFECEEFQLHKKEHKGFIMKTVEFCNRTMNGEYDIANDLLDYLQLWLVNHVQGTDKKLENCLDKNRLCEC
jgi:hemerythrin-like metal-binding protein